MRRTRTRWGLAAIWFVGALLGLLVWPLAFAIRRIRRALRGGHRPGTIKRLNGRDYIVDESGAWRRLADPCRQ